MVNSFNLRRAARSNALKTLLSAIPRYSSDVHHVDVFHRGMHLNSSYYCQNHLLSHAALDRLFSVGATIRLRHVHCFFPQLRLVCQKLADVLGDDVWVNAYLSSRDSSGLGKHHDDHSVLAFQLMGAKEWRVNFEDDEKEFCTQESNTDSLYIPKGATHQTFANFPISVHLAFGFNQRLNLSQHHECIEVMAALHDNFKSIEICDDYVETHFPETCALAFVADIISGESEVTLTRTSREFLQSFSTIEFELSSFFKSLQFELSKIDWIEELNTNKKCFEVKAMVDADYLLFSKGIGRL